MIVRNINNQYSENSTIFEFVEIFLRSFSKSKLQKTLGLPQIISYNLKYTTTFLCDTFCVVEKKAIEKTERTNLPVKYPPM